jgi:hypothetical protein
MNLVLFPSSRLAPCGRDDREGALMGLWSGSICSIGTYW